MPKQPDDWPADRPHECAAVLPLLESYLDGELSPAETEGVREHLARCPACIAELRLAEAIQLGLRALPELDAPPEVLLRVRSVVADVADVADIADIAEDAAPAVLPFERPAAKRRPPASRHLFASLAAALVLAFLGALLLFQLRSPRPTQPSPAEIAQATAEARYAIACIGRATRRAGLEIKDEILPERLVAPAARGLSRSLGETLNPDSAPRQGS